MLNQIASVTCGEDPVFHQGLLLCLTAAILITVAIAVVAAPGLTKPHMRRAPHSAQNMPAAFSCLFLQTAPWGQYYPTELREGD